MTPSLKKKLSHVRLEVGQSFTLDIDMGEGSSALIPDAVLERIDFIPQCQLEGPHEWEYTLIFRSPYRNINNAD